MATSPGQLILDQYGRLRKLMKEIPGNAPNFSRFNNRIVAVENMAESGLEAADQALQVLLRELAAAPDGMSGVILSAKRFGKYLRL